MKNLEQLKKDYEQLGNTIKELEEKDNFDFKIDEFGSLWLFSQCKNYNIYESTEERKLWEKKINALHALRLVANELNGEPQHEWIFKWGGKPHYYIVYVHGSWKVGNTVYSDSPLLKIYFKKEELAEKAIEYMKHYNLLNDLRL